MDSGLGLQHRLQQGLLHQTRLGRNLCSAVGAGLGAGACARAVSVPVPVPPVPGSIGGVPVPVPPPPVPGSIGGVPVPGSVGVPGFCGAGFCGAGSVVPGSVVRARCGVGVGSGRAPGQARAAAAPDGWPRLLPGSDPLLGPAHHRGDDLGRVPEARPRRRRHRDAGAGDGAMPDEVPAGTVESSRVNDIRPNTTAATTAAAADSPNSMTGTRRRDFFSSSCHSSWLKCSSGRLSPGPAS